MALEFVRDAISLSGLTGSKLKCEIIGECYRFWWNITSGGARANYDWPTVVLELDAATGEVHAKNTRETILGSSGHALDLQCISSVRRLGRYRWSFVCPRSCLFKLCRQAKERCFVTKSTNEVCAHRQTV